MEGKITDGAVTIDVAEYRDLCENMGYSRSQISKLFCENEALKRENETLRRIIDEHGWWSDNA